MWNSFFNVDPKIHREMQSAWNIQDKINNKIMGYTLPELNIL